MNGGIGMSGLLILGAGGHGNVVAETASMMGTWDTISFLDDRHELKEANGISVIGELADFVSHKDKFQSAFVAIGNNEVRLEWIQKLEREGFIIPIIIHPFSSVSRHTGIREGTVIMSGAVINSNTSIGKGCIINTSSSIDHDCIIEDGVHVSPGSHIGGTVKIGQRSWLCIGTNVANNINIGSNVVIAAGSTVIRNVPDNVLAAGVPAMIKKQFGDD